MKNGAYQHKRATNGLAVALPKPNSIRTAAVIASALIGSMTSLSACSDQSPISSKAISEGQSGPLEATADATLGKAQPDGVDEQVRQPPKLLNYDVQFTATVPACTYPSDVDRAINLLNSGNGELIASDTSCVLVPEGTKAVGISYLGSGTREIMIQDETGDRQKLWTTALAVDSTIESQTFSEEYSENTDR